MELMEPVSSAELLEKSAAPGLWLTARERCFRRLLMPRLSLAVLSSSILEGAQTHHFRSSAYCRKQAQTSLKQLCPTSTGKWATLQFTANHCATKGSSIRKLTGDEIDETPITSGDAVATWKIIFFPSLSIEHRTWHMQPSHTLLLNYTRSSQKAVFMESCNEHKLKSVLPFTCPSCVSHSVWDILWKYFLDLPWLFNTGYYCLLHFFLLWVDIMHVPIRLVRYLPTVGVINASIYK